MNGTNPLVHKTYCMLYNAAQSAANNNIVNWASAVKSLLNSLGMGDAWFHQGVGNVTCFIKVLEQRLRDNAMQLWNTSVFNSSGGILYREYKVTLERSLYLDVIKPKHRYQFVNF